MPAEGLSALMGLLWLSQLHTQGPSPFLALSEGLAGDPSFCAKALISDALPK